MCFSGAFNYTQVSTFVIIFIEECTLVSAYILLFDEIQVPPQSFFFFSRARPHKCPGVRRSRRLIVQP
jgi:hypothetical protein